MWRSKQIKSEKINNI